MADVVWTPSGPVSQAPAATRKAFVEKITGRKVTTVSGGGGRRDTRMSIDPQIVAQQKAEAQAKAEAEKKAQEEAAKKVAELKAKQQAELQAKRTAATQTAEEFTAKLQEQARLSQTQSQREFYDKYGTSTYVPKKDIKVDYKVDRTGQTYDPKSGMYVKAPYGIGAGGTAIMTAPTPEEKKLIDKPIWEKARDIPWIKAIREAETISRPVEKIKRWGGKAETWLESKRIPEKKQGIISPKGVKRIFDWGAEQTLKAGEKLSTELQKGVEYHERILGIIPGTVSSSKFFTAPSPIKRETAKEIISTGYMFSAFSPFMKTGTAQVQKSQYAYDVKQKRFVKKAALKEYLESPRIERVGKKVIIKDLTYSQKASKIKGLLSRATTQEQRKEILEIAQESYGKEFVKEFASQEFGYISTTQPTTTTTIFGYEAQPLPVMKDIAKVETTLTTIQPSLFGETRWSANGNILDTRQIPIQDTAQDSILKTITKTASILGTKSILDTKQDFKQDTAQDSILKTLVTTIRVPKIKTKPKIKQTPALDLMSKFGENILRQGKPTTKIHIPKKETVVASTSTSKITKRNGRYKVYVKQYGEWILIDETDSLKKATARLKGTLTGTLRASGFIEKGGKKVKLDLGGMFRAAKKDKKVIVQKRGFRLGTFGEVKEIKRAKKKAPKKKQINWLTGFTKKSKRSKSKWL